MTIGIITNIAIRLPVSPARSGTIAVGEVRNPW